ncbi:diaminopimelate epimerase [Uliginosibacterium gangwonense]|uniref:diaminopimelate epimerase n=1 Tax=Uliginosibacterium gangwonense TaxID=392736 RepID=UPI0003A0829A|nr:diaminopimelate epimerase [Uliginosibacterium gangwonense]
MKLQFTKMQGLGNDFVVIDAINQPVHMNAALARQLGDRRFGVGCDQLLIVERPSQPDVDFRYRIFNCEGSEVEQCGNGARCFARFVVDKGLTRKHAIRVETKAGIIEPRLTEDGLVTVNMGVPALDAKRIPFVAEQDAVEHDLLVDGHALSITAVSMGNPHAVQVVADVEAAPVEHLGPLIEHHPRFPARVNAGFMQIVNRGEIRLRVFERGAGETLACGTGACAAVVAGILRGLLDADVWVQTHGGSLNIKWAGPGTPVLMTGPAVSVFEGVIEISNEIE